MTERMSMYVESLLAALGAISELPWIRYKHKKGCLGLSSQDYIKI